MKTDYLAKLIELSSRIANIVDRKGEQGDYGLADELGLGYLALSGYLRAGAKAVIDMQGECSRAKSNEDIAKGSEEDVRDFLEDIFGDREPDTLNDDYKQKIREFVKSLLDNE